VATYTYGPYGARTAISGTVATPFGYAGQYTDAETGFVYLRARYYDPATAQFLSRDPLQNSSNQPYAYATDDPLDGADPSGLCDVWSLGPNSCLAQAAQGLSNWLNNNLVPTNSCMGGDATTGTEQTPDGTVEGEWRAV
jgi:RHS repeat-associated protein